MDISDPTRSITPSLDGPVLAVLATAGRPMTVGEIAQVSARGSEIGIRRCVDRLVAQGIVRATEMGRNRVHELNRQHIAAPIAIQMASLRLELINRLRGELCGMESSSDRPRGCLDRLPGAMVTRTAILICCSFVAYASARE